MSRIKVYENGIFNRDEFVIVYYVLGLDLGLVVVLIILSDLFSVAKCFVTEF